VWQKLIVESLLGNFADPLIYLIALGYGLGQYIGTLDGLPYLVFLASGIVCSSAMNTATFEGLFSAYTRMTTQKTWDSMLATPLTVSDIVLGETIWAGTKGLISATAILIVAAFLHLVYSWKALFILPIILIMATCFAALALIMTAFAKSYDFFTYYFTLFISPMMLLSGVFFPLTKMPAFVKTLAHISPLYYTIEIIRPLMTNRPLQLPLFNISILILLTLAAFIIAAKLMQQRIIN
jgi:lipooligosaccharide transport system permease protein